MQRTLTAVLAADVVGYSRMMSVDATDTLATLRRLRTEILGPAIAARRGRVVKSMGDGWIVTFDAVTDAVECAMHAQDRLKIDGGMQMRIGVHIGDVAWEDEDVYGEGVNIAARLQEIAEPGSLAVSDTVYTLLDGTLRPSFDDAGERQLKNIPRPLRVWSRGGHIAAGALAFVPKGFPRLAILPVAATDERADVRDLATALTGDLITLLDSNRSLTARVTENPTDGEYTLTPILRARGDRLRLETRLIAPDGTSVAAEKSDGTLSDSFDWQDEVALHMSHQSYNAIMAHELTTVQRIPEGERTVEQMVIAMGFEADVSGDGRRRIMERVVQIIDRDPDRSWAYAIAVANYFASVSMGFASHVAEFAPQIPNWMQHLDQTEPAHSPYRVLLAFAKLVQTGDADTALAGLHTIIRALPFDPEVLFYLGFLHLHRGAPEAAMEALDRFDKGPMNYVYRVSGGYARSFAALQLGQFQTALEMADASMAMAPHYPQPVRVRAAALAHLERPEEAANTLATLESLSPGDTVSGIQARAGLVDTPAMRIYLDGLRKAGMAD